MFNAARVCDDLVCIYLNDRGPAFPHVIQDLLWYWLRDGLAFDGNDWL
jgi:hypothetical protein